MDSADTQHARASKPGPDDWIELASPARGAPMTAKVERVAGPLRGIIGGIAERLDASASRYRDLYAPRARGLGFSLGQRDAGKRAAWALMAQWLVGYATESTAATATIADVEEWFLGERYEARRAIAADLSVAGPAELPSPRETYALLPYLLDSLQPGTRRAVLKSSTMLAARRARKSQGIYYTPADVAQLMADSIDSSAASTCLDPACGSGVFLRAARARSEGRDGPVLYGCDLDPLALEMCAFVLLAGDLVDDAPAAAPWAGWHLHRLNLACVDSLRLQAGTASTDVEQRARLREVDGVREALRAGSMPAPADSHEPLLALGDLFPHLPDGPELLLCNPPYTRLGEGADGARLAASFASLAATQASPASDVSAAFAEHAWRLTDRDRGRAALVLPLSVAFSGAAQFRELRRAMAAQPGGWRCAFFDRAPDALFGDDVKTRNAILIYDAARPAAVQTTSVLRWTSHNRRSFLASIGYTSIGRRDIAELIPKLADGSESSLYSAVRSLPGKLGGGVADFGSVTAGAAAHDVHDRAVYVAATAYNWLSCARSLARCAGVEDLSSAPLRRLVFADQRLADAHYALLSSRLVYWLWRVEGDAFHVSRRFIEGLPFDLTALEPGVVAELAGLGARLWEAVARSPVISVNKGRRTLAFPAQRQPQAIDAIDRAVLDAFRLRDRRRARGARLRAWYESTVIVDSTETKRSSLLGPGGTLAYA